MLLGFWRVNEPGENVQVAFFRLEGGAAIGPHSVTVRFDAVPSRF